MWQLKGVKENPRIVHITVFPVETKKNYFAQITVKVHLERVSEEGREREREREGGGGGEGIGEGRGELSKEEE